MNFSPIATCGGGGLFKLFVFDANPSPFISDSRFIQKLSSRILDTFDIILVCITDADVARSVRDDLIAKGVESRKILRMEHYKYRVEHADLFENVSNDEIIDMLLHDSFDERRLSTFISDTIPAQNNDEFSVFEFLSPMRHLLYDDVSDMEERLAASYAQKNNPFPIIGVSYALGRSGTTVLTQYLASLNLTCYPTNFLKPYFYTPLVGFKHYAAMLRAWNITFDPNDDKNYLSDFGDTERLFDVMEYSVSSAILGRKFYSFEIDKYCSAHLLKRIYSIYCGIMDICKKPLSCKIAPQEIQVLEKIFDNTLYLVLERDIYTHTLALRNLYNHRYHDVDSLDYYRSFAPKGMDFYHNPLVYAAVTLKNARLFRAKILENVPMNRKIYISYEEFCLNPKALFDKICAHLSNMGYDIELPYRGKQSFVISPRHPSSDEIRIIDDVFADDTYNIFKE